MQYEWARNESYYQYFLAMPGFETSSKMYTAAENHKFQDAMSGFGRPLTEQEVSSLLAASTDSHLVRAYLDSFERFAGALRCGMLDERLVYELEAGRVIRTATTFGSVIKRFQQTNPKAYLELGKV